MSDDNLMTREEAEELLVRLRKDESPFSSIAIDALRTVLALMEQNEELEETLAPAISANLSSAICIGCKGQDNDTRGYWLLGWERGKPHLNRPWHASCAGRALGEFAALREREKELAKARPICEMHELDAQFTGERRCLVCKNVLLGTVGGKLSFGRPGETEILTNCESWG